MWGIKRALSLGICLLALLAPGWAIAQERTAGLDDLSNWYLNPVVWRGAAGLPVDIEFMPPLVAQYNWAYGATVLGVNVRSVGGQDYYAVLATYTDGALDSMSVFGPVSGAARWHSGPYHLAAGLPDGRIVLWLTAPREYPRQLVVANDYAAGTEFSVAVYTPGPVTAAWDTWSFTCAYQNSYLQQGPALFAIRQTGNGDTLSGFPALNLPGDIRGVSYYDYPVPGSALAYVVLDVVRDQNMERGNNAHTTAMCAHFEPDRGWIAQTLHHTGLFGGQLVLYVSGGATYIALTWDESSEYGISSALELISTQPQGSISVQTTVLGSTYFPVIPDIEGVCLLPAARSSHPLAILSDRRDIWLGYFVPGPRYSEQELEYNFFKLYEGEVVTRPDGLAAAAYPVIGVAATAHWSTGNPEVFWVQQGSDQHAGGQLFCLAYAPPR